MDHIHYLSRYSSTQVASGNLLTDMSDHFANFIILHSSKKSELTERPRVRIFTENNKNNFKNLIISINWEEELKSKSVNEAMLIFNKKISISYNKSFPFKRLSGKIGKDKPWVTSGLKQSIKHISYQKYIFNQTEENKITYKTFKIN